MEQLTYLTQKETISSIEISELTIKNHTHVMRDIKALIEQGVAESVLDWGRIKINQQLRPLYILTKKGNPYSGIWL